MESDDDAAAVRVAIHAVAPRAPRPLEAVGLERPNEPLGRDGPELGIHAVMTLTAGASRAASATGIASPVARRSAT